MHKRIKNCLKKSLKRHKITFKMNKLHEKSLTPLNYVTFALLNDIKRRHLH